MNVNLIAEYCGFDHPAYFSRFLAGATGKSPLQYRKQQSACQRGLSLWGAGVAITFLKCLLRSKGITSALSRTL